MQTFMKVGLDALLTPENCVLLLIDRGENRRSVIRLRGPGQGRDVVDHDCGVVTVYVCQLERLVVNEE